MGHKDKKPKVKEFEIYEMDSMEEFNKKNESFLSILQSNGILTEQDTIYALPITNWEKNKIGIPINKVPNSRELLVESLTKDEQKNVRKIHKGGKDIGYYAQPREK